MLPPVDLWLMSLKIRQSTVLAEEPVKSAAADAVWLLHLSLSWGILLCTRGGTVCRYRHTSGVATGGVMVLQESHLANGNMLESITAAIFAMSTLCWRWSRGETAKVRTSDW